MFCDHHLRSRQPQVASAAIEMYAREEGILAAARVYRKCIPGISADRVE